MTVFDELASGDLSSFIFIDLPEDIKDTEDYIIVDVLENDNLMSLAHRHLGSVDLWYILYLFNEKQVIGKSMSINNFDWSSFFIKVKGWLDAGSSLTNILDYDDYHSLFNMILSYYMDIKGLNILEAIRKTNLFIQNGDSTIAQDIIDVIEKEVTDDILMYKIKIPTNNTVSDINRYLKQYVEKGVD